MQASIKFKGLKVMGRGKWEVGKVACKIFFSQRLFFKGGSSLSSPNGASTGNTASY